MADRNPFRVSLKQRAEDEGYNDKTDYLENIIHESVHTALCTEGWRGRARWPMRAWVPCAR